MKNRILVFTILIFTIFHSITAQSCLPEGISLGSQIQLDSFSINYPNCTEIEGNVLIGFIAADDITNLDGLNNITSIGGDLEFLYNDVLFSLVGLENLTSINGFINFQNCPSLNSLSGLDNVDYQTITTLGIFNCPNLSVCSVKSVCGFIEKGGTTNVSGNATGCNTISQIIAAYLVPVEDIQSKEQIVIRILTNPVIDVLNIESEASIDHIQIINLLGQNVLDINNDTNSKEFNVNRLTPGIYFAAFLSGNQIWTKEFI